MRLFVLVVFVACLGMGVVNGVPGQDEGVEPGLPGRAVDDEGGGNDADTAALFVEYLRYRSICEGIALGGMKVPSDDVLEQLGSVRRQLIDDGVLAWHSLRVTAENSDAAMARVFDELSSVEGPVSLKSNFQLIPGDGDGSDAEPAGFRLLLSVYADSVLASLMAEDVVVRIEDARVQ